MKSIYCSQAGEWCDEYGAACVSCRKAGPYWQMCEVCGRLFYGVDICDECLFLERGEDGKEEKSS